MALFTSISLRQRFAHPQLIWGLLSAILSLALSAAIVLTTASAAAAQPALTAPSATPSSERNSVAAPASPTFTSASTHPNPCKIWAKRFSGLNGRDCVAAGLKPLPIKSVQGLLMYQQEVGAKTVQPVDAANDKPPLRILVVGGIHGDEPSSVTLAMQWLKIAQSSPQPHHWRFLPATNPDGLFARPAKRTNARGVDLNRNFATANWNKLSQEYWEKRTRKDPRRYPGSSANSEPETKLIVQQIEQFKPQLIVSIHAPYGVLDFDGPAVGGYEPPSKLGRLHLDRVGVFPGSLGNYAGLHKKIPVVTIELPKALTAPAPTDVAQMWDDLHTWIDRQALKMPAAKP